VRGGGEEGGRREGDKKGTIIYAGLSKPSLFVSLSICPFHREEAEGLGIPECRIYPSEEAAARDLPAGSLDYVCSTFVLCSVPSVPATLQRAHTWLKSGGKLLFLEHVGEPRGTLQRRVQRWLNPCWGCVGGGCRLDREIGGDALKSPAKWVSREVDEFRFPGSGLIIRTGVEGRLIKG
jgi:SAM-dependent methyltransferase